MYCVIVGEVESLRVECEFDSVCVGVCVCVDSGAEASVSAGGEEKDSDGHAPPVHCRPDTEILELAGPGDDWECHALCHALSCSLSHALLSPV